jgi:hypothetical protein
MNLDPMMPLRFLTALSAAMLCAALCHAAELKIEAATQKLLDLETQKPAASSLPPETTAYASVISPAPLIELFRQSEAAQAAIHVTAQSVERAEKLFTSGELVARKDLDALHAQSTQDTAARRLIEDKIALEWGAHFSTMTDVDRSQLIQSLLASEEALLKISLSRGVEPVAAPVAARLHAEGRELAPVRCTSLTPAASVDPLFQGQAFIGQIANKDHQLISGMNLTGVMELPGEIRQGILIPQSAVVFHLGKAWAYRKSDEENFERMEIPINSPVAGGWFVAADTVKSGELVTRGAQALLSSETFTPEAAAADEK